jgi:hypothetical protein
LEGLKEKEEEEEEEEEERKRGERVFIIFPVAEG